MVHGGAPEPRSSVLENAKPRKRKRKRDGDGRTAEIEEQPVSKATKVNPDTNRPSIEEKPKSQSWFGYKQDEGWFGPDNFHLTLFLIAGALITAKVVFKIPGNI